MHNHCDTDLADFSVNCELDVRIRAVVARAHTTQKMKTHRKAVFRRLW